MRSSALPNSRPHALAIAISMLCASLAAHAQTKTDTETATIVVTGQRASLEKAQDIKRNADQVVDSIVADDIGKLPDTNVAEALQRVTGVQITRNRAEGDRVQVRGLQQTQTLLNGRVVFSAGKERGLSFQDFPSELLAGVDVYKTPTADHVEGGIGGVIDLRTRKPFDFSGSKVAGTLKGAKAELADKSDASASLLVSNRWKLDSGEFGALISLSAQKRGYRADTQDLGAPALLADGSSTLAPTGQWLAYEFGERERHALSIALQWRPNATSEYSLDWSGSKVKTKTDINGHYASPFWANYDGAINQGRLWPKGPITTDASGRFVKGEFWGANMSTSGSIADEDSKLNQLAIAGKWRIAAGTTVKSELSHTSSDYDRLYNEVRLGTWANPVSYVFDMSTELPSGYSPQAQLSNPGQYFNDKTVYFKIKNHGSETAWRADVDHSLEAGVVSRVRGGIRLSDRKADSAEVNSLDPTWMFALSAVPFIGLIPQNDLLRYAGSGKIATQWLTVLNPDWLRDPVAVAANFGRTLPSFDPKQTFDFSERSTALYGSLDLDTTLAGKPLTGNLGLRAVNTRIERSYIDVGGVRRQADSDETDWLPALNLRWELDRDLIARFALSKVITRPNFDQLTPSLSLNVNDLTGFRGNPALGKLSANQLDSTLEYYLSPSDHVYGALFLKNVKGFIQTSVTQLTINGGTYSLSTPSNGDDGRIRGLELGYQGFFKSLPGWGLQANATLVDSSAPSPINGLPTPLDGLSKKSANVVLIYDHPVGLSARLAYNWRSEFGAGSKVAYPGNDGTKVLTPVTFDGYSVVDAYLSYAITPKVKVALEGNNLTRTVRRSSFSAYGLPNATYVDGRRIGVSLHVEL